MRIKSVILTTVLVIMSFFNTFGAQTDEPDFAYPQTVAADATKVLENAADGPTRLRALLELTCALQRVDPDTAFAMPALVQRNMDKPGLTDADRAMFTALQAKMFTDIYNSARFKYDRVDAPLEPLPADVNLWSGKQFKKKISDLYAEAAAYAEKDNASLELYKSSLEMNNNALRYIPDVRGFVALKNMDWMENSAEASHFAGTIAALYPEASQSWFYWQTRATGDRKTLLKLYKAHASEDAARYVLYALAKDGSEYYVYNEEPVDGKDEPNFEDALIVALKQSLGNFPDWYGNAALTDCLNRLTRASVNVSAPKYVAPNSECEFTVRAKYVRELTLTLDRQSDGSKAGGSDIVLRHKRSSTKTFNLGGVPDTTFTVKFPIGIPGKYDLTPHIKKGRTEKRAMSPMEIEATPFMPVVVNGLGKQAVMVADFTTGAPMSDIKTSLVMKKWRSNAPTKIRALGSTDRDGILEFTCAKHSEWPTQYLRMSYKARIYDFDQNLEVGGPYEGGVPGNTNILIFTDRALYHPGDSIRWAAVLAVDGKTIEGADVTVTLRNANGEEEASENLRTDAYGRVEGTFATRKGILTGQWCITVKRGDSTHSAYVTVSDFRLPTFTARVTSVERDVPAKGCVRISGNATTFSGMPVVNADVNITVSGAMRWRWFAPVQQLGTLQARTDAAGNFAVDVPAEMLAKKDSNGKLYADFYAAVTVTAQDGEAADTSRGFTTGKPYSLYATATKTIVDSSERAIVKFEAYNADGKEVPVALKWALVQKEGKNVKEFLTGTAKAGQEKKINISKLAAGYYTLRLCAADTTLADSAEPLTLTVYNESAGQMPADQFMFVPVSETSAKGGKAEILVGINAPEAYVYAIVKNGAELSQLALHKLARGFHRVAVPVSDPAEAQISVVTVHNGNVASYGIRVKTPEKKIPEVKAESFRDRLTPGAGEQWRFRLLDNKGAAVKDATMIATLYNKALDELANGYWPNGFNFYKPSYNFYLDYLRNYRANCGVTESLNPRAKNYFEWPQFRFIDNYFAGRVMYKMRTLGAAAPTMNSSMAATDNLILEGVAEEEAAEDLATEIGAGSEEKSTEEPAAETFEYRTGEALQAFWKPSMVADSNGNIDLTFTVPNANGTWQMKAFAWNRDCTAAQYMAQCVANKPVMVNPNLPRFLRQGDKATILATVFNNSDEQTVIASTIEIFDIATGETLQTAQSTDTVAAKGSAIVAVETVAPVDAASIGYRVRSQAGSFADGEQQLIPVLSAATAVIESTEFYLNPNEKKPFEFTVKDTENATLTLQYCQNPVWTAVKAMRGINCTESNVSTRLVGKIFSALAARKIIGGNKTIADALRQWADNPSEKALVSMLEKNDDLKRLLLDQTPWAQTAANQTQRMAALAEVLDPDKVSTVLNASTAALEKLRNADGGFAWATWSEKSSEWSTETVLTTLGIAYSLDMLHDKALLDMVQPAFNYLVKEFLRYDYPERDSINIGLTTIAAMMPFIKLDADAKAIIDRTDAYTVANWRKGNVGSKAWDVIMLKKSHPAEAEAIMESIRQYGVYKSGTGLSFPSISDIRSYATIIQAYKEMNAPAEEIDRMRQWVLVQAQASDDFGAYNPDYIVAALMLTGSDWTSVPVGQNVKVDGQPVVIDKIESATGYFAQQIKATGNKVTVSVQPNGVTPSYGSVIAISRKQMKNVKARPGRDLSIEKRVLVQRGGEWVETNSFSLGERVRVQLTIVAKRSLKYVTIDDERPATFEPVDQLPGYVYDGSLAFYRENLDASTRLFIGWLGKGTYHVTYDMTANVAGSFISGIATLQSQYAPELTAHSSAARITVE